MKKVKYCLKHEQQCFIAFKNTRRSRVFLRPSLPEDQAGVIHAISPIWMKLCQIEGTTKQL